MMKTNWTFGAQEERDMFKKLHTRDAKTGLTKFNHSDYVVLNDKCSYFRYKHADGVETRAGEHVSVPVAVFVTAHARTKLYEALAHLQHRVLYFDTDSVIFYTEPNEKPTDLIPTIGSTLGEWENELNPGEFIDEYVSLGPKNYGYRVKKTNGSYKFSSKIKGIFVNTKPEAQKRNYQSQRVLSLLLSNTVLNQSNLPNIHTVDVDSFAELEVKYDNEMKCFVFVRGGMKTFSRHKNLSVFELNFAKRTRSVVSKRELLPKHIRSFETDTYPFGYE